MVYNKGLVVIMQLAPFFLIRYPSKAAPSPSILPMKLQKKMWRAQR